MNVNSHAVLQNRIVQDHTCMQSSSNAVDHSCVFNSMQLNVGRCQ
jgi:hypothetical protein